jgi:hypothetical protein
MLRVVLSNTIARNVWVIDSFTIPEVPLYGNTSKGAAKADRATKNRAVPNSKTFFMTAPFDEPIRAWQGRIIGRYSAGSKSGAASRLGLSAPNRRIEIPEGVPFAVAAPRRLI